MPERLTVRAKFAAAENADRRPTGWLIRRTGLMDPLFGGTQITYFWGNQLHQDWERPMRQVHSTDSVRTSERLEYWHHVVTSVFWPLQVSMPTNSDYRATVTQDVCGAAEVAVVSAQAQAVRRTRAQAQDAPSVRLCLGLLTCGFGQFSQDGRDCRLAPGEAALFDPSRPYRMSFPADFSLAVFHLPAGLLGQLRGGSRGLTARTLSPTTTVTAAALAYLSCMAAVSTQSGLTDVALTNGAPGIVTTLVRDALGIEPDPSPTEALERAVAFIDIRLHDAELSPAEVARNTHVSLRQLYRVFDASGQGVAETIRDRRLARARTLLESLPADTPVSWIGARVGFGSAEQFTRAFRDAHGMPPGTWRATRDRHDTR